MSDRDRFWQAKIQGLLHILDINPLRGSSASDEASPYWHAIAPLLNCATETTTLASQIADASDRASLNAAKFPDRTGNCQISHLLSGASQTLENSQSWSDIRCTQHDLQPESEIELPEGISWQEIFWWLWRCLPEIVCKEWQDESVLLIPAADILPDASVWSYASLTAALSGALTGFKTNEGSPHQLPYLATFSFSPIQELIKASRKMRDFWAGSWVLHYLSAKICWKLANKYGPDSLIYPSLFQQPLMDYWLRNWKPPNQESSNQESPNQESPFREWIEEPSSRAILTAGFPNVIVILLPPDAVRPAMSMARQTLIEEWLKLGNKVFQELENRQWTQRKNQELKEDSKTWKEWLRHQWQTYWTALPIADRTDPLKFEIAIGSQDFSWWSERLNRIYALRTLPLNMMPILWLLVRHHWITCIAGTFLLNQDARCLFQPPEVAFVQAVSQIDAEIKVNVGSWWCYCFDELRQIADTVKCSRSWRIPTVFLPRSTISGTGPVVYYRDGKHISEGETASYWQRDGGLFDGTEQLNATETLKRGLHKILPDRELFPDVDISAAYPDLTSGVAGWLRTHSQEHLNYFLEACEDIRQQFPWMRSQQDGGTAEGDAPDHQFWGIPWVDEAFPEKENRWFNPRVLNAGWAIDDFHPQSSDSSQPLLVKEFKRQKQDELKEVRDAIAKYFSSGNNPTDWYVLAAGDGDGMGKWLRGENLKNYEDYMPDPPKCPDNADIATQGIYEGFDNLKTLQKRMGPSTHDAFSRALLDFSNQLVPYLTEQRYAGRLIYSGGDDVLAYTNLWEWDSWLWDIRQCFRGAEDPKGEFDHPGDYWKWRKETDFPKKASKQPWEPKLAKRPLFTMGQHKASLSFGIVIAHHSVPLAIALENLWSAEGGAKEYEYQIGCYLKDRQKWLSKKDALQIRIIYGNGNILKVTGKFSLFEEWQRLIDRIETWQPEAALFEQAAQWYEQNPIPCLEAIAPWTQFFCLRREEFAGEA